MSLPWVRLHVPLLDNEDYKRFSPQAQHLYMTLLMLAGKQDQGDYSGRLEARTGPLTLGEVRSHTKYHPTVLTAALEELLASGFVVRDQKTLVIDRFREKAAPLDVIRKREKRRDDGRTAAGQRPDSGGPAGVPEAEADNYEELRSSAKDYQEWPTEPDRLANLARIFLARFANTSDEVKARRQLSQYCTLLASMRQRGATIEQAWKACEDCWSAGDKVPLWGGKIKQATSFLPPRITTPRPVREEVRAPIYQEFKA